MNSWLAALLGWEPQRSVDESRHYTPAIKSGVGSVATNTASLNHDPKTAADSAVQYFRQLAEKTETPVSL